jgi:hypothetical protein
MAAVQPKCDFLILELSFKDKPAYREEVAFIRWPVSSFGLFPKQIPRGAKSGRSPE